MRIHFAVYDTSSGEIRSVNAVSYEHQLTLYEAPGVALLPGNPPDNHYVDLDALEFAERPSVPTPTASYDLTALPEGTTVTVTDESNTDHTITDLTETLTLEGPQVYQVRVAPPFPYMPADQTVEVT